MLAALAGASWVVVATVPAPPYGEVVAHTRLDLVTVTSPSAGSAKLYDSKGKVVRTVTVPSFEPKQYTDDSYLAMTAEGAIVQAQATTDIDSYGTHPWTPHWARLRVQLGTGGEAQSVWFSSRRILAVARSWDRKHLYFPTGNTINVRAGTDMVRKAILTHAWDRKVLVLPYRLAG